MIMRDTDDFSFNMTLSADDIVLILKLGSSCCSLREVEVI